MYILDIVWDLDPVLIRLPFNYGPKEIRYYGLLFATGIFIGYLFWRQQIIKRLGHSDDTAEDFVVMGFFAILIGARLGHCLFYDPAHFLANPLQILVIWQGGLASHGATLGLITALYIFHRKHKIPFRDVLDSLTISAGVCGITIRLGNFMNSEIVGRVTDVPWAIKFPLYSQYMEARTGVPLPVEPRHPSQLYEALLGLIVFITLILLDRYYKEKRPRGLFIGIFFVLYFSGRFIVEYFKEFQTLQEGLTMGQILSVPFVVTGIGIIIYSLKYKEIPEQPHKEIPETEENNQNKDNNKSNKSNKKNKKNNKSNSQNKKDKKDKRASKK